MGREGIGPDNRIRRIRDNELSEVCHCFAEAVPSLEMFLVPKLCLGTPRGTLCMPMDQAELRIFEVPKQELGNQGN